jgi:tRNA 2-selenouridine synthase
MAIEKINIENFLKLSQTFPVIDVRSPGEYLHAHIPGAFSIPLFTDEQRKEIGTAYKKESRQKAVKIGLEYFSEIMKVIPGEVIKIQEGLKNNKEVSDKTFLIHCWRGGMRSDAVAWLLNLFGYKIYLLNGGYKSFRRWALQQFEKEYSLKIIGGYTGSGKTEILEELKLRGEKIIDLEGLANHRGSAFGALGQKPQPAAEMFENLLALVLWKLSGNQDNEDAQTENVADDIWVEDESAHIGTVGIPKEFWLQMRKSKLYFLDIPFEERLKNIVKIYGDFEKQKLNECVLKIQKRLGGLDTKNTLQFIEEENIKEAFSILLKYYDKMYGQSLQKRENIQSLLRTITCTQAGNINVSYLLAQ